MSSPSRALLSIALLSGMTAFGLVAVYAAPDGGRGIGIWPVALATATLMIAPRRVPTGVLLSVIGLLAIGTIWLGGRDLDVAVGVGAGLALEVWVTWRILTQGRRERAPLYTVSDLARFLVAVTAGALTIAVASAVTSAATGWGDPAMLALTIGSASLAAQLTLLPFFCLFRHHAPVAGPVERAAQWTLLLAVTIAVFVPTDSPSLVLLVLPVLAWGALRNGSYESLAQMAVAVGIAMPLTTAGYGPFAQPNQRFDVPVDMQGVLLASFACVCALMVLALRITVGEQHEFARQVAAERDRMKNVVDGITGVAIIGADLEGRITIFNPGAQRLLGYQPEDVLGQYTRMLHSDRSVAERAAELGVPNDFNDVALALIGRGPVEMTFLRKDGTERRHSMSLNRVIDDRGQAIGYVSTSEDITERLETEARLVESLEAERRAVEQLREVDRVKDAFVSSVSHELRTPITSIVGYTELMAAGVYGELDLKQLDAIRRVRSNSNRLLSLISELLTFSKVQDEDIGAGDQVIDLTQVVAAALEVFTPTIERRDLELVQALPEGRLPVTGDREMLERVVINLVDNAVKFTPDGGRVTVTLTERLGAAIIEVADTGIGVPPHEQQRLFDRFFRSSLAQQQAIPGSGLGLSIAHKIVEKHGGTLEVCSEVGVGSTFTLRLPVEAAAAIEPEAG